MTLHHTLMAQVAKGDQNAFRQLAKELSASAYALAYRLLNRDAAAAEDVLQEVLLKMWQTAPKYQPTGSVRGYMHRLTYTTSMDRLRKTKPTVELVEEVGTPETMTDKVFHQQRKDYIYEALNQLPERQRSAVVLTYLHEMPQRDVAETLGTSVKAVESLLVRAKQALRQSTGREWMGDAS